MEVRPTLSLCMVVKNEELLLGQALEGMREFVDECIVIDTGSTDRTVEIAKGSGAKLFHYDWDGSLGRARNAYLKHATGSWVLVLDGDERVAKRDRPKLRALIEAKGVIAYRLTVHNYTRSLDLLGDWHANTGTFAEEERFSQCPGRSQFQVVRLFKRLAGVCYEEGFSIHTNPLESLKKLSGKILEADVIIHHFQFLKGGDAFIVAKQEQRLKDEIRHTEDYPHSFLAHLNVGRTLFSLGKDKEALRYLNRAIHLQGESEQAYFARGVLLYETMRFKRAARDLETAVALKADFADAWTVLGMAYHALGRLPAAERSLAAALRYRPQHPLALNSLGVLNMDLKRVKEAELNFRKALQVLPGHPIANVNLITLYERQGMLDDAQRECAEALHHRPEDSSLLQKLSDIRERKMRNKDRLEPRGHPPAPGRQLRERRYRGRRMISPDCASDHGGCGTTDEDEK